MQITRLPLQRNTVAELLYVERQSLGDSDYAVDEALQTLRSPAHHCLGAYEGDTLAGFISCFETCTPTGARLELDLLGVLPAQRNRGIATALIVHALDEARAAGLTQMRTVVRDDNAASLAAFRKAGLTPRWLAAMMIWGADRPAAGPTEPLPITREHLTVPGKPYLGAALLRAPHATATALAVTTLAYRGCWIEEVVGESAADRAALATAIGQEAVRARLDEAGMLVPCALTEDLAQLVHLGWQEVGRFHVLG